MTIATTHPPLKAHDKRAYDAVIGELGERRWATAVAAWRRVSDTDEWRTWAELRRAALGDGGSGVIHAIRGARRTAAGLGGWELLVAWKGEWSESWESEASLQSTGKGLGRKHQKQAKEHKDQQPRPNGLWDRLSTKTGEGKEEWEWADAEAGGIRMSAGQIKRATVGDLGEGNTKKALAQLCGHSS